MRARTPIPVSDWAAGTRRLGDYSDEPGRWKNERTPYLRGPMDAFTDPDVEWVVVMSGSQIGKTEAILNCLGYCLDVDPGTALLMLPDEKTAGKFVRKRVYSLVKDTPELRGRIVGGPGNLGLVELNFDRMTVYPAWANSPASAASFPCKYVFLDEVGKYPKFAGREASPVALAEKRTRTFRHRRRIFVTSTPTRDNDLIVGEYERTNKQTYFVPCPHCGHFQLLDFFKGLKWEKGASPDEIYDKNLAWYECEKCDKRLNDEDKIRMLGSGCWVPKGCEVSDRGVVGEAKRGKRRSGFHIPGLLSPWTEFREYASEFVLIRGDKSRLMDFYNSELGLPWVDSSGGLDESAIAKCTRNYKRAVFPKWAKCITVGVDVQEGHFWFVVRAWGPRGRSALMDYGMLISQTGYGQRKMWEPIQRLLDRAYPREDGADPVRAVRMNIDSGYNEKEVYDFVFANAPRTWATKGSGQNLQGPISLSKKIGRLVLFKNLFWKDMLARHINTDPGEPGEWVVFDEIDAQYSEQIRSERRVRRPSGVPIWQPLTEDTPNHLWDCEVLALLAAHAEGVHYMLGDEEVAEERKTFMRRRQQRDDEDEDGGFRTPGGQPYLVTDRDDPYY